MHKSSATNIFPENQSEKEETAQGSAAKPVVRLRKPKNRFWSKTLDDDADLHNTSILDLSPRHESSATNIFPENQSEKEKTVWGKACGETEEAKKWVMIHNFRITI